MHERVVIFDWGDTVMRDFSQFRGPMVFWPQVEVTEGLAESLPEIHRLFSICIASNAGDSDAMLMAQALERVEIRRYFDFLYTSKELGSAKPSPKFFQEIVDRIAVRPEQCVMVGNDYEKDIIPAKMTGMKTILYQKNLSSRPSLADATIQSMYELFQCLKDLDN
ncbi:HAD family hydrolase [Desulfosporosinus nitroreducens]|uniref:HAD family hydrolase n=1 Tax=Desulfosporosinus nitroreducens TaxID=2018668 RepID=A0ABT8QZ41_9FIRM|nr:HAD family hydrolase [Desulfosporosinus nitroreducens]MDO0825754.1 HAD family hydrolase [Desulfosporosinus nitroreducens]